jgi:hypothetical protein
MTSVRRQSRRTPGPAGPSTSAGPASERDLAIEHGGGGQAKRCRAQRRVPGRAPAQHGLPDMLPLPGRKAAPLDEIPVCRPGRRSESARRRRTAPLLAAAQQPRGRLQLTARQLILCNVHIKACRTCRS